MNFFSDRNFSFSCKDIVFITHGRVLQDKATKHNLCSLCKNGDVNELNIKESTILIVLRLLFKSFLLKSYH